MGSFGYNEMITKQVCQSKIQQTKMLGKDWTFLEAHIIWKKNLPYGLDVY